MKPVDAITVTVITFNEEENIRRCLESVSWADEIIVVDSYSSDRTVEIARAYASRVIRHEWEGYIEQKTYAVSLASNNWIFSLDADEQASPELSASILQRREQGFEYNGYEVSRKTYYLGRWIHHGDWYPACHIRLFHRERGFWGGINPHDKVCLNGKPGRLEGELYHYTYGNVSAHLRQIDHFTSISAGEMHKLGSRTSIGKMLLFPFLKFIKCYFLRAGILDGRVGLVIALMGSFYVFSKHLKMWELEQGNSLLGRELPQRIR